MSTTAAKTSESAVQFVETPVEQLAHPRARSNRCRRDAEAGRGHIYSGDASRYAYLVYAADSGRPSHVVVDGLDCPAPNPLIGHIAFSPDGSTLAYVASDRERDAVVCNGVVGRWYDAVRWLALSGPGTGRCAYAARHGDRALVVCDETEGPDFDEVGGVMFSPDGARLAYWGDVGAGVLALIEGLPDALHLSVSDTIFSPRGDRVAYVAGSGERLAKPPVWRVPSWEPLRGHKGRSTTRMAVVLDGEIGPSHDEVNHLQFSADGGRFAYFARRDEEVSLIVDGTELARCDHRPSYCYELQFSPDGQHTTCVMPHSQGDALFVDGELVAVHHTITDIMFSPEGERIAYVVSDDIGRSLVLDGRRSADVGEAIQRFWFAEEHCIHLRDAENGRRVDVDGHYLVTFEAPDDCSGLVASPDGAHLLVYSANGSLVLDGRALPGAWAGLYAPTPTFSANGRRYAWAARAEGGGRACVVDGIAGPAFGTIGGGVFELEWGSHRLRLAREELDASSWIPRIIPGFSPDSRHFAYAAASSEGRFVVVDRELSPRYDELVSPPDGPCTRPLPGQPNCPIPFVWEHDGLRYMAVRDGVLYRVTARVGSAEPRLSGANFGQA